MLRVFCGNDTVAVRQAAFAIVNEFEEKGVAVVSIDSDTYGQGCLVDAVGATSLFGGEELYVLDTPSNQKDFAAETSEQLEAMAESPNQFIVIEGPLLAADKKPYQKHAYSFEEIKKVAGERFNAFSMADALARKDKKMLWLLLQEAQQNGLSAEEIIGTLWWQLKAMRVAAATKNATEAGMKDFPYNKAKRALAIFSPGELETLSESLLKVYHTGHAGVRDINLSLERWALTLEKQ